VSRAPVRHRKPSRFSVSPATRSARHRRRSLISAVFSRGPALVVAVAGATLIVSAGAALAVTSWPASSAQPGASLANVLKQEAAGGQPGPTAATRPDHRAAQARSAIVRPAASARPSASRPGARPSATPVKTSSTVRRAAAVAAPPPVYRNPLRAIQGLVPERVDMGTDFGGSGPIYAIGNAVVTNATGDSAGWPGGGWITYRLTSGPASGLQVYVAEDVKPAVQVGQDVTSSTVVANMYVGSAGIETGWAMADGLSAESQLPEAGSVSGGGPFPTKIGLNFDSLLITLGVPAGFGYTTTGGYGTVPPSYPSSWASLRRS
jgi:hypothetical protein